MIRAVLFDFDGVIVDSFETWRNAVNDALASVGCAPISPERFKKEFWGIELKESMKRMGLSKEVVEIANRNYFKHLDKLKLNEGVAEVLREVNREYKTALVTNTPKEIINHLLNSFNLNGFFHAVVTGDDVRFGKPHPDGILKACKILNVEPKETILIGDTMSDVIAGKRAKCKAIIGIGVQADFTVPSLRDVLRILQNIDSTSFSR